MPAVDFLPRKLQDAFSRLGVSEPLKGLLALQGNPEYCSFWDDFTGTRSGTWPAGTPYASTVGVNVEVIGLTQAVNGTMTVTTAAADGDSAGQGFGLNWSGDNGFYFIARVSINRITLIKFEIGMTDAVNDDGAVLVKATPSFTATDCALFVLDRTDDAEVTFVSNGGTTDANADATDFDIAATTFFIVEIVGRGPTDTTGDNVTGYINGQRIGSGNINGASPLTIWAYAETLAGASAAATLTVDYWGCIGPRTRGTA